MPIQVTCQCGQRLTAKDEFAGKRVKCPKCGGPLLITPAKPAASEPAHHISDLLDDVGMRANLTRCPGCGAELSEESVLCVICGFDMRRGHRLKTRVGSAADMEDEELGDLPVHGNPMLDFAERQIARDKLEQQRLSTGTPWWMIMFAFLGVVGFAIGMVSMPQSLVVRNSGWVLIGFGGLVSFYYSVRLIVVAFKESLLQGLLVMFFPLYVCYYIFSRWDRVGPHFVLSLVGTVLIGLGVVMVVFVVPMFENMKSKKKDKYGMLPWENRPTAVYYCHDLSRI